MFDSIEIAKIFGPLLIIMGIWGLLYQKATKKFSDAFKINLAVQYLGGLINLILGLTLINSNPHWHFHLNLLVKILGWTLFLKGLVFFILPKFFTKIVCQWKSYYALSGLISILWGLALLWLTFNNP